VQQNLKIVAEKMIKRLSSKKTLASKNLEPLIKGDNVRISTSAITEVRAMGDIKIKSKLKKGQLYGFTKELYKVLQIKTKDDGNTVLYRVNDTGKRLYYLRHQLQKVDTKDLIKTGQFSGKSDDNFNQGSFNLEGHLAE
jgi:hypothetical protein